MNDIERYGLRPQVAAALQAGAPGDGWSGGQDEKAGLLDLLHVLRKRKATILSLAVGTFALTAVLTILQHPIYQAKTSLLVSVNRQVDSLRVWAISTWRRKYARSTLAPVGLCG